jgi:hypothetical protein
VRTPPECGAVVYAPPVTAARRVLVGSAFRPLVASATKPDPGLLGPLELAASDLVPGAAKTSLTCTPAGGKVAQ